MGAARRYRYVGPAELRSLARPDRAGQPVRTQAEFAAWLAGRTAGELAEPFTFVVDRAGALRLAPRRSEHVVCAGGDEVLCAGEIGFRLRAESGRREVETVGNQSTGYCPDTGAWPPLAEALDRAGIGRPAGFTYEVVFRRCPVCREVNVVREGYFFCVFCDGELPARWNVD
ncbi:hypothetical protein [Streptomyces sp. NPDC058157]|uniref:hypothetical protein n=1 Tax=Streptomyces sp. NPDC058157 TaxID=3346360 RepID=UPI0036EA5D2F